MEIGVLVLGWLTLALIAYLGRLMNESGRYERES